MGDPPAGTALTYGPRSRRMRRQRLHADPYREHGHPGGPVEAFRQASPEVMLQKIIYDWLIGNRFLRNYTTTYDLARAQMIFAAPD